MLWRGQQSAIGELMTSHEGEDRDDGGERFCMGYATFAKRWNEEKDFRAWFESIEEGLAEMVATEGQTENPRLSLVYLQHMLVQLLDLLDVEGLQWDKKRTELCQVDASERRGCKCKICRGYFSRGVRDQKRKEGV